MSGQLLELIIFAAIAIFLVNKLINLLGTTSEEDMASNQNKKRFANNSVISGTAGIREILSEAIPKKSIVKENKKDILKGLKEITAKIPNFTIDKFLKGAKGAFEMIIQAGNAGNESELAELVDRRYLEHFKDMAASYGEFNSNSTVKAEISEIYMFGNNAFVKVLFAGKNITSNVKSMHEEWTFTKNTLVESPIWQLSNIDRPQ